MTIEGLEFINFCLEHLQIPYEFMEWTSELPSTYFVGEYHEVTPVDEDGLQESDFILTGITKEKYIELESVKEKIRKYFTPEGFTTILPSGSGIAIMYNDGFLLPSIEEGIHRIQITLKVKEWGVN